VACGFCLSTCAHWSLPLLRCDAQTEQHTDKPHLDSRVPRALSRVCEHVRWRRLPLHPTPRAVASAPRELHTRIGALAALSRYRVVTSAREPCLAPLGHQRPDNTCCTTSAHAREGFPQTSLFPCSASACVHITAMIPGASLSRQMPPVHLC
jgi:hypothetical protein